MTAVTAVVLAGGFVLTTSADASVTSPGNGATVVGTITLTESPGGTDTSSILGIKHCGGNTSTVLQVFNSGGTSVAGPWSNGGGTLTESLRTESLPNGSYTVRGTENNGANSGFLGTSCKTNTTTFNNSITIRNAKHVQYTGVTSGTAGTNVTVSAHVTDPNDGSSPVSGQTVNFTLGGTTVTGSTNANGDASASLPVPLTPGTPTLSIDSPATSFYTDATTSSPFTIQKVDSSVAVAPTTTIVHGQSTTLSATVTGVPAQAPTGSVQFYVDGDSFGAAQPVSGSTPVSVPMTTPATGVHEVYAVYSGDGLYNGATSATVDQHVDKASTLTTVDSSLNPAVFGQPITLKATVAVVAPGVGSPSGAVQFDVDGQPYGTAVALNGDTATLLVPTLGGGNHDVTATYNGDTDFAQSTSPTLSQGVDRANTTLDVESSANPSVTGQGVTFSVDVSAQSPGSGTPTGSVQFTVDGDPLGDSITLVNGAATSPTITDLTPGKHTVLVDYSGDANFSGGESHVFQKVDQAATTTTVDSTPNPSVFGQPVTFSASVAVTSPGAGTPTGTVQFYVDGNPSGSPVALNSDGTATSDAVSSLTTGTHDITAAYSGDDGFAGSASGPITQTVNKARTATTLTSSANPSVFGQPVTFIASVAVAGAGAGNPTGTITFTDGSQQLGVVAVGPDTNEQASITTSALNVGPHAITATYSGDDNFQSSSDATSQNVQRAHTSLVVASSADPAKSGQAVTFTATVSPVAPGAGTPTGTVQFTVNGAPIGSAATVVNGVATSTAFSSLSPGNYAISATYSGDGNFLGSSGDLDQGTGLNVTPSSSSTTVESSANPAAYGATVSFTVTVTPGDGSTGHPSGVVDVYDGDQLLGAASLSTVGGVSSAVVSSAALASGSHAIRAVYLGNYNFTGSEASLSQTVGLQPTVTGLSAAPNPVVFGNQVTLTATVSSAKGTPTGSVSFRDGSTVLGTADLSTVQGNQVATLTVPQFEAGTHHLTAQYSGATVFAQSTSGVFDETVQQLGTSLVGHSLITTPTDYPPGVQVTGNVTATLTDANGAPLAGQTLVFTSHEPDTGKNFYMCTSVTDANGLATCGATNLTGEVLLNNNFIVTYAGTNDYAPSSIKVPFDNR